MRIRRFFLILLIAIGVAPAVHAHVKASLVAAEETVQPGRPFTIALRLEHEPHWHTYWIQAGTGYATSLTWKLPPGWQAGEIEWPTPIVIHDLKNNITGNGYEGVVYLPLTITPPANAKPGETVTLAASAEWLMCDPRGCVPGDAAVELTLPVAGSAPKPSPAASELAKMPMPQAADGWSFSAKRAGKTVTLDVTGPKAADLKEPWFFADDAYIQFDEPQSAKVSGTTVSLTLPISAAAEASTARLSGVLAYKDAAGAYHGVRVLAAFDGGAGAATVASSSGSSAVGGAAATLGATLGLAFVGGLILNLMPCVFPVLGIKILGFVNQAGADRRKVTLHGLVFTLGVLMSFWSLAGLLAVLRAGGDQLGWGFQLQSPAFVFSLAAVMLVFALSMSGVFEFGLRATAVGSNLQMKQGFAGSFFTGVLATVVATPCSAPFLAPALGAALALSTAQSFLVFTVIGIGLSLPYLTLSIFPGAVKVLPRPGAWMETFKQVMAFPLYATVAFLVWVLAGQTSESGLLNALFGLTIVALAAWLYGRYATIGGKPARVRFGVIGTVVLLAVGAWLGWPRSAAPGDIVWEAWSPERVAQLQAEGRPIYVDFTARWCATCQSNKKYVFGSAEVRKTFDERKVATLKADWTNRDARITAELAKWNRSAVPFNLVYVPGKTEPQPLPELLTPSIVLDAVQPGS